MTPIERAAKAIYESRNGSGCKPWARLTKAHRDAYLVDARAAIGSLEPTQTMIEAAPGRTGQGAEGSMYAGIFRAMINAALEGK